MLVSKYCDHLPLYRQSRIFARDGVELDRSTLAGWVGKTTALLEPLADAVGRHVLTGQALFADDTPVKLLAPGTGKTATGRAWAYVRDERPWQGAAAPAAWYRFSADRKATHPKEHLAGFSGWMHSDGYAGFGALARAGPIREVACLAHIRRKFFDVHAAHGSAIAAEALERKRTFQDGLERLSIPLSLGVFSHAKGECHVGQRCCSFTVAEEGCGPVARDL